MLVSSQGNIASWKQSRHSCTLLKETWCQTCNDQIVEDCNLYVTARSFK